MQRLQENAENSPNNLTKVSPFSNKIELYFHKYEKFYKAR